MGNVIYLDFTPADGSPQVEVEGATIVQEEGEDEEEEEKDGSDRSARRPASSTKARPPSTSSTSSRGAAFERGGQGVGLVLDDGDAMDLDNASVASTSSSAAPMDVSGSSGLLLGGAMGNGTTTLVSPSLNPVLSSSRRLSANSAATSLASPICQAANRRGSQGSSRALVLEGGAPSPRLPGGAQGFNATTVMQSPLSSTGGSVGPMSQQQQQKPKPAPLRELVLTANANGGNRGAWPSSSG